MNEPFSLLAAVVAGFLCGMLYFYGLWLTISKVWSSRHVLAVTFVSFVGRATLVVALFWWLAQNGLGAVTVGMLGFLAARSLIFRITERLPVSFSERRRDAH